MWNGWAAGDSHFPADTSVHVTLPKAGQEEGKLAISETGEIMTVTGFDWLCELYKPMGWSRNGKYQGTFPIPPLILWEADMAKWSGCSRVMIS